MRINLIPVLLILAFLPAGPAGAQTASLSASPWTTTSSFITPTTAGVAGPMIAGPIGDLYVSAAVAASQFNGVYGDQSQSWTWISRIDPSGGALFSDRIGGASFTSVIAVVAANHNGIIAGTAAGSGLPATAGAWAPSPIGASDKFVCEV
ncbi:MAG TPA: hypothetical protein VHZ74_17455, partial [Bryobacteraceae bacterium]|nr:hypothetical protein [Bryobacteraceae bacterium]